MCRLRLRRRAVCRHGSTFDGMEKARDGVKGVYTFLDVDYSKMTLTEPDDMNEDSTSSSSDNSTLSSNNVLSNLDL